MAIIPARSRNMIKVAQGCLGEEELEELKSVWNYGYYGLSYKAAEFEDKLKEYLGAKNVVSVNTGTSALHLALDALGIGKGDKVIVPSLTFVASFQAISATGATPVPCDVYPDTLLMNMKDVMSKITPKVKAIMPVHYCGNPCDMEMLMLFKKRCGVRIIEDAAHALGSTYNGQKVGSFGDITCFSFDSIKNITCGEGGAIVCSDDDFTNLCKEKRLLGIKRDVVKTSAWQDQWKRRTWAFEVNTQGFRYHMSQINAAIGVAQLRKIDSFIARRREICRMYDNTFKTLDGIQPLSVNYDEVAPHLYVIRVKKGPRNSLKEFLQGKDIETAINYIPNHLHPFYAGNYKLPETDKAYDEILSLPLHCALSDEDVRKVIGAVIEGTQQCQP